MKALKGDKRAGLNEPAPAAGEISVPSNLSDGARVVWARLAPDLIDKGVLTPWDVDEFAAFCDAVERRDRAASAMDEHGEVIEAPVFNRNGEQTGARLLPSPWWQIWKGANDSMLRYGARFGLSPSDRTQLKVNDGHSQNPEERFFAT